MLYSARRFRISTQADLLPTNLANDGEVEDYRAEISEDSTPPSPCGCPFPDFVEGQGINSADLLEMIQGVQDGNVQFDLTGEGTTDSDDLVKFSLCWYQLGCSEQ